MFDNTDNNSDELTKNDETISMSISQLVQQFKTDKKDDKDRESNLQIVDVTKGKSVNGTIGANSTVTGGSKAGATTNKTLKGNKTAEEPI